MVARKLAVAAAVTLAVLTSGGETFAACPEGDWFCDESESKGEPGRRSADAEQPEPASPDVEQPPATVDRDPPARDLDDGRPRSRAWPPVVYPPSRGPRKATYRSGPEPGKRFGLNGHANLALLDNDPHRHRHASMQGIGAAFRFRPIPLLGLDVGPEFVGGRDYNGDERFEVGVLANALLFIAPSKRFELHLLAGFGFSAAFVREDDTFGDDRIRRYGYVGLDFGVGFDWYLTRRVALGIETLVFVRSRGERGEPEFVDPNTHRATSTSAAALIRPGVTVYF